MRIISGKFKKRTIDTITGDQTRPTSDKVKEAIFSMIGPYFDGGKMLDLFAGSGALGLECLSRGMDYAIFCDHSYEAIQVIKKNIEKLQVQDCSRLIKADYKKALALLKNEAFDFIYVDPPYAYKEMEKIIHYLLEHQMMVTDGLLILEANSQDVFLDAYESLIKIKEQTYGITKIVIYRKQSHENE